MKKLEKKNIEDILALTPMQEGMLFHHLENPESDLYFEQLCLEISGQIDPEPFRQAWDFVTANNEMLRTVFRREKMEKPTQLILKKHKLNIRYYDFSNRDEAEKKKLPDEVKAKDKQEKFHLHDVPFRVTSIKKTKDKYMIIISSHHILYDGWSTGIILDEFFSAYNDLCRKKIVQKTIKSKFKQYIGWIQRRDREREEKFWENYFWGFETPPVLSVKRATAKGPKGSANFTANIGKDTRGQLERFAGLHKLTMAALLYSAWGLLLQRYNNSGDVIFGTTVSGRSARIKNIENMVGLFINTLPLRVQTYPGEKTTQWLKRIHNALQTREPYEYSSLVKIKEYSRLNHDEPLFDTIVVIENYPLSLANRRNHAQGKLSLNSYSIFEMTNYDLTVGIIFSEGIQLKFVYNNELFEEDTVSRLAVHFIHLLKEIAANHREEVVEIDILPEEERARILFEFNGTETHYPGERTLHGLFEEQVERTPDNIAVMGMARGAGCTAVTYRELNERSNQLALSLPVKGVQADTIVGIMMEPSLEMVVSILGILKSGAAYLPIDANYPEERKQYILKDSGAEILLATGDTLRPAPCAPRPAPGTLRLAYIIYTSGSTGRPKGVLVEHRGIVNTLICRKEEYKMDPRDVSLQLFSYAFDGFLTSFFTPLISGTKIVLPDSEGVKDISKLKEVIIKEKITHFISIPSLYRAIIENLSKREASALKVITLAGDRLLPDIPKLTKQKNPNIEIAHEYGVTEASVMSSICRHQEKIDRITIGKPIWNTRLYIINRHQSLQPIGAAGELCISGKSLARGYLNNPELTTKKFCLRRAGGSFEKPPPAPPQNFCLKGTDDIFSGEKISSVPFNKKFLRGVQGGGFFKMSPPARRRQYRTGDLARWFYDGNIEFLGRMDLQVKVRGFRIELGEIESQLMKHEKVKEAVVIAGKSLCAYFVGTGSIAGELRAYLLQTLPVYMVPAYFVALEKIPLTATGKIDRKKLPGPGTASKEYLAPGNEIEEVLTAIWSEVLAIDRARIGVTHSFFELGGHSLRAISLTGRIHKAFDVDVPISELFKTPTIRGIARYIEHTKKRLYHSIEPAEEQEYYPLVSSQEQFYIIQQLNPLDISYNISEAMLLEGRLAVGKLETAFKQMIHRHESLRTSFHLVDGEPVQRIHDQVEFHLDLHDLPGDHDFNGHIKHFIQAFDLSRAPLLRAGLIKIDEEKHILVVDIHHIISDGVSTGIFIKEFVAFYEGKSPPPLRVRYKDYIHWMKRRKKRGAGNMVGEEDVLNLPLDYARPTEHHFEGSTVTFEAGKNQKEALNRLALQQGTTLYMVLLSAFNVLLAKLSGQENIVVGSPIAGRVHHDLEGLIGLFIKTVVLRNFLPGEKRFLEFLTEVKANTLGAFEHQEYQYEELLEQMRLATEAGSNPLFDVMFVLQNMEMPEIEVPGLKVTRELDEHRSSKFDLTLYCIEKENLVFKLEYSTRLFKKETVQRFIIYFKEILSAVLEDPRQKTAQIDILPDEERSRVLYEFNDTAVPYPKDKTIYRVLEERAAKVGDGAAVIGKAQGAGRGVLTYNELNKQANRLARRLRTRGAGTGSIIAVMMERSLEIIVSILAILKAGGAYLPIDPEYPESRVNAMLKSAAAAIVLTGKEIFDTADQLEKESGENLKPLSGPGDLIYIIFTSGSTGKPKGAGVFHRGFMNLMHWFVTEFELEKKDANLLLTSLSFDLTQKNLYASLMTGGVVYIPPLNYFDPRAILREIHEHQVSWINCTPSMFYRLVEQETSSGNKKLTSLRYVFLGGEPIAMTALIDWLESPGCRAQIINTYGPTECTDICASYRIAKPRRFLAQPVPVGKPIYNVQLHILNKDLLPQPIGITGELFIAGQSIGPGYINTPQLTTKKFCLRRPGAPRRGEPICGGSAVTGYNYLFPFKQKFLRGVQGGGFFKMSPPGRRRQYRTGDLGRWLGDGNIEFLGRIDFQVKVRGFRIELGEIENRLVGYENVKEGVVIAREGSTGDKYLCAYIVVESGAHCAEHLKEYLAETLPDYMVPSYIVQLEKIPLTPNGKLDRKALPEPEPGTGKGYVPPAGEREKMLVDIWAEILGLDKERIGVHDNFFQLGGHSLNAAGLTGRIHKAFSVEIPIAELFKNPTIKHICRCIDRTAASLYSAVRPVEKQDYYPLSSAQKRLYFLRQFTDSNDTGYNMPFILPVGKNIEIEQLESILKKLIARHESLRTSFEKIDGVPVQRVHDRVEFKIENYGAEREAPADIIGRFVRSFDLSRAPLVRSGIIRMPDNNHTWMVDMHHIVSDGTSTVILREDFTALYSGEILPELRIQYRDFAQWQNRLFAGEGIKSQIDYWLQLYGDAPDIPRLNLPADDKRPEVFTFTGDRYDFILEKEEARRFKQLAAGVNATLYMNILTALNTLFYKYTGQPDIIIGTGIAGRPHDDLQGIIGMFVNTLAMRNYPRGEKTYEHLLKEVIAASVRGFENQDVQFEELVDRLDLERDTSRNPLFEIMLVVQNFQPFAGRTPGQDNLSYSSGSTGYKHTVSRFDLSFFVEETGEDIYISVEYYSAVFKRETIARFARHFKKLIREVAANPGLRLAELDILSEQEKEELLYRFNHTRAAYPADKTIAALFEEQVEKTPARIAVIGPGQGGQKTDRISLSYRELNKKAHRSAYILRKKGLQPGAAAGIMMERSIEMMIGIYAVLKAGGAYLPIDPDYPEERKQYMLKDSSAEILLATGDTERNSPSPSTLHPSPFTSLAYIIYTSGTTGKPKGVMIEHHSLINRLNWMQKKYPLAEGDTILHKTPFTFDVSVWEIFWWAITGARVCLLVPNGEKDPKTTADAAALYRITVMHFVPSMLALFLEYLKRSGNIKKLSSLKQVIASGEALTEFQVKQFKEILHRANATRLANLYGPTEATIDVSYFDCFGQGDPGLIPIGKPIDNIRLYILDKYFHIQPIGIVGELCIAGVGLARGYLNRPELTAEKFVNPSPLYKTGDLARWLPDGNIEFLGRLDHQVKVRGFRIELEEIENRLLEHPAVKEAAAIYVEAEDKRNHGTLCACIVSGKEPDAVELREHLSLRLPGYMVPSIIKRIEAIPLTSSGKVDRKALRFSGKRLSGGAEYTAPVTPTEAVIARTWKEILRLEGVNVGIHDNFFDLGGTSMDVIRLNTRIAGEFEKEIPLVIFYKYTTIRALANYLDHGENAEHGTYSRDRREERIQKGSTGKAKMREMRKRIRR